MADSAIPTRLRPLRGIDLGARRRSADRGILGGVASIEVNDLGTSGIHACRRRREFWDRTKNSPYEAGFNLFRL